MRTSMRLLPSILYISYGKPKKFFISQLIINFTKSNIITYSVFQERHNLGVSDFSFCFHLFRQ